MVRGHGTPRRTLPYFQSRQSSQRDVSHGAGCGMPHPDSESPALDGIVRRMRIGIRREAGHGVALGRSPPTLKNRRDFQLGGGGNADPLVLPSAGVGENLGARVRDVEESPLSFMLTGSWVGKGLGCGMISPSAP